MSTTLGEGQPGEAAPGGGAVGHVVGAAWPRWTVLLIFYLCIAATPLLLAWLAGYPRRPWNDEVSSAAVMVAFAMLLMEFVTTGRIPFITARLHHDGTMKWHRTAGTIIAMIAFLHPYFYTQQASFPPLDDPTRLQHLGLNALSLLTGITGLVLLVALVITAAFRDQLPYRYETWRIGHTLAAAAVASLILTHALVAGRYSHIEAIRWFWIVLATVALLALVYSFIIVPQAMRRHPYRLVSLTPHKPGQWLLVFEPVGFALPTFRAGQFVWVSFRSPFSRLEHPLNVPSAPAAANTVAFVVHERGDWSRQVGQFRIGATAFLNGPYG